MLWPDASLQFLICIAKSPCKLPWETNTVELQAGARTSAVLRALYVIHPLGPSGSANIVKALISSWYDYRRELCVRMACSSKLLHMLSTCV